MKAKSLLSKQMLQSLLIALTLCVIGTTKGYGHDFSAVCPSGQTLYYYITNYLDYEVRLTSPNSGWTDDTKPVGNVVFPSTVTYNGNTYTVIGIGSYAFSNCSGITSITIPNTITYINSGAFYYCTGLPSVTFPSSLTTIDEAAFAYCSNLTSFTIPSSVTTLHRTAFTYSGWYNNQPDGYLCKDGWCIEYKGTPSGSLVVPSGTTRIASCAFYQCTGFTGTLSLPNTLVSIGAAAFSGCTALEGSITIPNSVTTIGGNAFYGCTHFHGSLTLSNSLVSIGVSAFNHCTNLTGTLSIPSTLVTIGNNAFYYCRHLTGNLVFPSTLESIGNTAFGACYDITSVTIPGTSTTIGEDVFESCSSLSSVTLGISEIPEGVFDDCSTLTSLTLLNTVTSIGGGAFYGCSALPSVNIPNSVTYIGDAAFYNSGLTSVTIPNSVQIIGADVFMNTVWFNNLPDGAYYANNCCLGYKGNKPTGALTIAANTRLIAGHAFSLCDGLTSVSFPNTLIRICSYAFYGCSGLTSVVIPDSCTIIGAEAFAACSGLTSVSFGEQISNIGGLCFDDCPNIAEIYSYAVTPPTLGYCVFDNTPNSIPVHVPWGSISAYSSASGWNYFYNFQGIGPAPTYTITVSANPSNGGSVTGGGTYTQGATCNLIASANTGYSFVRWTKNGVQVSTNPNYSFTVTESASYVAVFNQNSYTISASANPSMGGSITGTGNYNYGSTCTVTASANSGYSFVNWTENGTQVSTNASYSFTVNDNRTLVANFNAIPNFNVSVSANPSNAGTVTGGGSYQQGQTCTVTASANSGYSFVNWTENGNVVSTNANYTFNVTTNRTLVANFTANTYTIAVSANPTNGGTVSGGGTFNYGQSCTVNATPATGYTFTNWTENGNVVSTNASYTFSVNDNRTLVANFNALPVNFNVSVSANPSNAGTVTGGGSYQQGQTCTVTASANSGYSFVNWTENGTQVSTNASYSFTVNANRTLVANFTSTPSTFVINTSVVPAEGGTVIGAGTYQQGVICTVVVIPNEEYEFVNWTENGIVVSEEESFSFVVDGNHSFVAHLNYVEDISEYDSPVVTVFPNPSREVFNLEGNGILKMEVINAYGQIILSKEVNNNYEQINLRNKACGMYLLRLVTNNGVVIKHLFKK